MTIAVAIVIASATLWACPMLASGAAGACGEPASRPWCATQLSPDRRAGLLLRALTEPERLSLLEGDDGLGGTSNGIDRLGVPAVHFTDGTAGIRQGMATGLPVPLAVAATFDPGLARLDGDVLGVEARDKGFEVFYGPTLTIMRTPLGGRTFQAFGEDPLLQSRLGAAEIEGIQSRGVIADANIMAANTQEGYSPTADQSRVGQFPGPAPTEGSRFKDNAVVDERTLREIYLPPFEAAVKTAHVGTTMCAYNAVNDVYSCQNRYLLTDVLRSWGFTGFTLSDYGAAHSTVDSLRNGLDFEPWPPGGAYLPAKVETALTRGSVRMAQVNAHVERYLRTLFAFGAFDRRPYFDNPGAIDRTKDAQVAERVGESAITLLSNRRSVLPLNAARLRSIAILGAGANSFITGGGSSSVFPYSYTTAQAAIATRVGPRVQVRAYDGSDAERAAKLALRSDVAIVVAPNYETEGVDRRCLTLECPSAFGNEDALISRVASANRRTIVVLETGGPVLTPWRNRVAALVEAWYPGEQGGTAIARVLFGDSDPGGRLPVTFPVSAAQTPTGSDRASYPGINSQTFYKEGTLVGYRWYDAHQMPPAFAFGFGLSYTRFAYGSLHVSPQRDPTRVAQVSFTVANIGSRTGIAVPQLYLGMPRPTPQVAQPPHQLRAFESVSIRARTRTRVTFSLTARDLAWWDVRSRGWRVVTGCYQLLVGSSSRDLRRSATIAVGHASCQGAAVRLPLPTAAAAAASLI